MYVVLATSIEDNWRYASQMLVAWDLVSCWSMVIVLSLISGKRNEKIRMEHGKMKRRRGLCLNPRHNGFGSEDV